MLYPRSAGQHNLESRQTRVDLRAIAKPYLPLEPASPHLLQDHLRVILVNRDEVKPPSTRKESLPSNAASDFVLCWELIRTYLNNLKDAFRHDHPTLPSCPRSFYTTPTLSLSIHDLIVVRLDVRRIENEHVDAVSQSRQE